MDFFDMGIDRELLKKFILKYFWKSIVFPKKVRTFAFGNAVVPKVEIQTLKTIFTMAHTNTYAREFKFNLNGNVIPMRVRETLKETDENGISRFSIRVSCNGNLLRTYAVRRFSDELNEKKMVGDLYDSICGAMSVYCDGLLTYGEWRAEYEEEDEDAYNLYPAYASNLAIYKKLTAMFGDYNDVCKMWEQLHKELFRVLNR